MSTTDLSKYIQPTLHTMIYTIPNPAACFSVKLRVSMAIKAKSLHALIYDVMNPKPVGYRNTQARVRHWIKALNVFLFAYPDGSLDNKGKYQIEWAHHSVNWNPTTLKYIAVYVSSKEDKLNPLMCKLTLFYKRIIRLL